MQLERSLKRARPDEWELEEPEGQHCGLWSIPDELQERILAELGPAEAWRTARRTCRQLRALVDGIEWKVLEAKGSRPEVFGSLAAAVWGGRLRLKEAAAVRLDVVYGFLRDKPAHSSASWLRFMAPQLHWNFLGDAAFGALRACSAAAGGAGLGEASVRLRRWRGFCENRRYQDTSAMTEHIVGVLDALQPPATAMETDAGPAAAASCSRVRGVSIACDEDRGGWGLDVDPGSVRRALSPFSGLQSLALPHVLQDSALPALAAAVVEACPSLRSLLLPIPGNEAPRILEQLARLEHLEELRAWSLPSRSRRSRPLSLDCDGAFVAFLESPAGRNLRVLGDRTVPEGEEGAGAGGACPVVLGTDVLEALPRLPRLERLDFAGGVDLRIHAGRDTEPARRSLPARAVARLGDCPALAELAVCVGVGVASAPAAMRGLAEALENSTSLRHLDLYLAVHEDFPQGYGGALGRLLAAAAPLLRSFHAEGGAGEPDEALAGALGRPARWAPSSRRRTRGAAGSARSGAAPGAAPSTRTWTPSSASTSTSTSSECGRVPAPPAHIVFVLWICARAAPSRSSPRSLRMHARPQLARNVNVNCRNALSSPGPSR
eukprot:tig00000144_g9147.t1